MYKRLLRTVFLDTLPVMAGYVFLGFGFGILMQQNGFGVLWAVAMSLFIYAGSMQYVAISLLTSGASLLTAALTALFVTIFVEQWLSTKKHGPAIVGVAATTLCLLIFGKDVFLIPSMAAIAACLIMMRRTGKEDDHA